TTSPVTRETISTAAAANAIQAIPLFIGRNRLVFEVPETGRRVAYASGGTAPLPPPLLGGGGGRPALLPLAERVDC
ncbi:MAG: hypothetical protein ACTHMJ_20920, partial [Thermomicrobiales bacterium]